MAAKLVEDKETTVVDKVASKSVSNHSNVKGKVVKGKTANKAEEIIQTDLKTRLVAVQINHKVAPVRKTVHKMQVVTGLKM